MTEVEVVVVGLDGEVTLAHQPELPPAFIPLTCYPLKDLYQLESKYALDLQGLLFHHDNLGLMHITQHG